MVRVEEASWLWKDKTRDQTTKLSRGTNTYSVNSLICRLLRIVLAEYLLKHHTCLK